MEPETIQSLITAEWDEKIQSHSLLIKDFCSSWQKLLDAGFELTVDIQPGTAYDF